MRRQRGIEDGETRWRSIFFEGRSDGEAEGFEEVVVFIKVETSARHQGCQGSCAVITRLWFIRGPQIIKKIERLHILGRDDEDEELHLGGELIFGGEAL